jgi:hypothetical protein
MQFRRPDSNHTHEDRINSGQSPCIFPLLFLLHRVSGQFDVERDILSIANGTRLPPELVRGVVVTTGSIVETNRVLELVSAGLTNWDVSDCGEPNSDDEEEEKVVVKVEKPRVKRKFDHHNFGILTPILSQRLKLPP